jgi:hypothetical protein
VSVKSAYGDRDEKQRPWGEGEAQARAPTANNAGLQCGLVPGLRRALLFADLFEVVVDERLGALGNASGHVLQTGSHDGLQSRAVSLPKVEAGRGGGGTLPDDVGARKHWRLRTWTRARLNGDAE